MSSDKFAARVEDDTRFALLAEKINEQIASSDGWTTGEIVDIFTEALRAVASEERAEATRLTKEAYERGQAELRTHWFGQTETDWGAGIAREARTAALEEVLQWLRSDSKCASDKCSHYDVECCLESFVTTEVGKLKGERG